MNWAEFRAGLEHLRMTQGDFAKLTGFAEETISRWQHRKRGVPLWVKAWIENYKRPSVRKKKVMDL